MFMCSLCSELRNQSVTTLGIGHQMGHNDVRSNYILDSNTYNDDCRQMVIHKYTCFSFDCGILVLMLRLICGILVLML